MSRVVRTNCAVHPRSATFGAERPRRMSPRSCASLSAVRRAAAPSAAPRPFAFSSTPGVAPRHLTIRTCCFGPRSDHLSGRRQTDLCKLGKKATLPQYGRSVNLKAPRFSELDIYQHNPWSAPGSAPVADAWCEPLPPARAPSADAFAGPPSACCSPPCAGVPRSGLAGGSPWDWNRAEAGNYVNTTQSRHGQKGTTLPALPTGIEWKIGGEAEVQWQVRNNHGGGYSYRLCPADSPLTEECFKKHQLDFVPDKAALLWPDGSHMMINGTYVGHDEATRNVTDPPGSMWARIPIAPTALGPVCIPGPHDDPNAPHSCAAKNNPPKTGPYPGGACGCSPCPQTPGSDCSRCDGCGQPAFPPFVHEGKPAQGVGPVIGMVDSVKVPSTLAPGKYVLGFRYDW